MRKGRYYKWFVILFALGVIFIIISLFMIPFFFIAPKKLALWFNLGVICIMAAYAIYHGFKTFFLDQFLCAEKPRNFFAIAFTVSMLLTLLMALAWDSFVGTLIFIVIEIILFIYFVASSFPGGTAGVSVCFKAMGRGIKNICTSCCKKE